MPKETVVLPQPLCVPAMQIACDSFLCDDVFFIPIRDSAYAKVAQGVGRRAQGKKRF